MQVIIPDCPYLCQYDNLIEPASTCNMTSLGMALLHYGKTVPGPHSRISDNLSQVCLDEGLDHGDLGVIAMLARRFGLKDNATTTGRFADMKNHLKSGNLVICQGYFTRSGHVIPFLGFDEEKGLFLANDPAGNLVRTSREWETGDHVWYPSEWFREAEGPDGTCWMHFLYV